MQINDSFEQLMLDLRSVSQSKSDQGSKFERLMKKYFLTSPLYSEIFEEVWLWSEFPYANTHDIGIDLVAKVRDKDEFYAIQCKFYDVNNSVSKDDVDTFISASGKAFYIDSVEHRYSGRIIVSTTDKWSSNAEETINGQLPPVNRIRLQDLKDSGIDWDSFTLDKIEEMKVCSKKKERPHQVEAIDAVINGFKDSERGKLIMACGTGKTFTALKIAEAITNGTGNVLFLVPSISLLNQTLVEWTAQSKYKYRVYAICSDPKASKTSDNIDSITDLVIPATTDVNKLIARYVDEDSDNTLNFFFSTYQSIEVVAAFQKKSGINFNIIICDEAHRTTGVTLAGEDESNFVKVHSNDFIKADKRLYMTATPRIYGDESKKKASEGSALLCSMDDESIYGKEFYCLGFSKAVSLGLLADYKVIVLAVDEAYVSKRLQSLLTDKSSELTLDDSVKILGCLNGLSKRTLFESEENYFANDPTPMRRAVAFNSSIKASKKFVAMFEEIQNELMLNGHDDSIVTVQLGHVDGTDNALVRKSRIDWLKENTSDNSCRVLSNARCLSEGIDVPALDAVMFLNPRNSIVDIIQSVGRVMRRAEGKQYGYIILPIGIPAGMEPEDALNDNKRYKIVWDVLQALRAHDDRFNNTINKIDLNKKKPDNIQIIGVTGTGDGEGGGNSESYRQLQMNFDDLEKWKNSVYAKIVKKCGSRRYWETWAKDIADIANRHIEEIKLLIKKPEIAPKFKEFLKALQQNLNSSIKTSDAIEMLAQHMITKPVFDALFEDYEFVKSNPVSRIMQDMLAILDEKALDKEQETLDKFYLSVQERAKGIDNAEGKQKIIIELYEQFFKNALPKQVAKLGIVYTPVEVVDFIIKSVDYVLRDKFNSSLNDKGVHVLDPFTGTGTFIVRLLRSGLIDIDNLLYKYTNEIHANEIVLLAYYIATINIEETFHDLIGAEEYTQFEGIVLTDTFAMTEKQKVKDENGEQLVKMFAENSARAEKQLESPITVIIGNPPYSVGQKSGNDNNQNSTYKHLDQSIASTYVFRSTSTLTRNAYDSYIRAFRWATDRIGDNGIIGFVSNGSYLDSVALDGFRQCLIEEFNHIFVFNLRGNQRTSGELSRKEGGKIFGSGSRTPVAITILVKRKGVKKDGYVRYHDIGDYLSREQKLSIISEFGDISAIKWNYITPNDNNDWIGQRNETFSNFIALGDRKKSETLSFFGTNIATGIVTSRDSWVYGFSKTIILSKVNDMIAAYNAEVSRCWKELEEQQEQGIISSSDKKASETFLMNIRSNDATRISWSAGLTNDFCRGKSIESCDCVKAVLYRPFTKKRLVYNKGIIERPSKWDSIFPNETLSNLAICISGTGSKKGFSTIISDCMQDFQLMYNAQCFPMYMYDREEKHRDAQMTLFGDMAEEDTVTYKKRFAISDAALTKFKGIYGDRVTKEDIFYYLYAVLHSKDYIEAYADNLAKEMVRIPTLEKFPKYVEIGRQLAELHLHYEAPADAAALGLEIKITKEDYAVSKMRFKKVGKDNYKGTIIFNDYITISNIPERAYEYVVNGRSAIEWIMESYRIKTDKDSGITDDPNTYGDKKYIFNLLISVISVSLKTLDLIESMPEYKEI
ncbi:DEAD/DEAH box helicase [Ruminococcus sp.]|uniref:DEAD/DEAH box helicase n=1 Tax=Ruminococcus sp. TaxID=41978 RepID=UPI003AF0FE03